MANRFLLAICFIVNSHAATFEVKSYGTDAVAINKAIGADFDHVKPMTAASVPIFYLKDEREVTIHQNPHLPDMHQPVAARKELP
jgi:hypothetical protein